MRLQWNQLYFLEEMSGKCQETYESELSNIVSCSFSQREMKSSTKLHIKRTVIWRRRGRRSKARKRDDVPLSQYYSINTIRFKIV